MPGSVAPPTRRDDIEASIPVEVADGKAIPAARDASESPLPRHVAQTSVLVMKDTNRPPFGCEGEVGPPVAIQVREDRGRYEADGSEHTIVDGVWGPPA